MKLRALNEIKQLAIRSGWSERDAILLALRVDDLAGAERAVATAKTLPGHIVATLLRDQRRTPSAQVLQQALKDAAEMQSLAGLFTSSLPENFATMDAFVRRDNDGAKYIVPLDEARRLMIKARADADVHIDTARRVNAQPKGEGQPLRSDSAAEFDAMSARFLPTKGKK